MEQTEQKIIMLERMITNKDTKQLIKNVIEMYQLQLGTETETETDPL